MKVKELRAALESFDSEDEVIFSEMPENENAPARWKGLEDVTSDEDVVILNHNGITWE